MPLIGGTFGRILNWLRDLLNAGKAAGAFEQKPGPGDGWKKK